MSRHYGVKCEKCNTPIIVENLDDFDENKIQFQPIPLTPIPRQVCGHSALYGSENKIEFEIGESPK